MDLSVLHNLSYGMYLIGAADERDRAVGCIVNTVAQITSENPMLIVSMNKSNYTGQIIQQTKRFTINILSENTSREVIGTFGFHSSKDTDKFEYIYHETIDFLPVIKENCCGTIFCKLIDVIDAETHDIFICHLIDTIPGDKQNPMTYAYYHQVIKGKAPKTAPTYQPVEQGEKKTKSSESTKYVCSVCGYIHEGDINKEEDDYRCPVCGVAKDKFVEAIH